MLHFLILGGAIFAFAPKDRADRRIEIDASVLASLEAAEARRLGVPALSDVQRREVANRAVEDEILYREALRLGLDDGDPAVRQRLILKVLFLAEDIAGASGPFSDEELRAHWAANTARFREPAAISFMHVFASDRDVLLASRTAVENFAGDRAPPLGEAFPLSRDVPLTAVSAIAEAYGSELAASLSTAPIGSWIGPLSSKHGWHFVRVLSHRSEMTPPYSEIARSVEMDLRATRKQRAIREYVDRAAADYEIELAGARLEAIASTARTAPEIEVD